MEHHIRETIEIIAALAPEDRRAVLHHFHEEMRAAASEDYGLPGGGMSSGAMVAPVRPVPSKFQP